MDRNMLKTATSSDDTPPHGFLLAEISRATLASYQACVQLLDFLLARIKKDQNNVKFKCLVIIRHVCRSGRVDFKREMGRHIPVIKECITFRGPQDPLRGDELNKRVREAAKEAMEAVVDSHAPVSTSMVAASNRIQGMGGGGEYSSADPGTSSSSSSSFLSGTVSNSGGGPEYEYGQLGAMRNIAQTNSSSATSNTGNGYSGGNGGGYGGSSTMTGMGNPHFKDPRDEKTWVQRAKDAGSSLTGSSEAAANATLASGGKILGEVMASTAWLLKQSTAVGGGSGSGSGSGGFVPNSHNGHTVATAFPAFPPHPVSTSIHTNPPHSSTATTIAANDGTYERSVIATLCNPVGLKAAPNENDLAAFLATASTLSPELVGGCLVEQLNSDAWQARTKALMVIAHFIGPRCQGHARWWGGPGEGRDSIQGLVTDSKASVRTQAVRTLQILEKANGSGGGDTFHVDNENHHHVHNNHNNNTASTHTDKDTSLLDFTDVDDDNDDNVAVVANQQGGGNYSGGIATELAVNQAPLTEEAVAIASLLGLDLLDSHTERHHSHHDNHNNNRSNGNSNNNIPNSNNMFAGLEMSQSNRNTGETIAAVGTSVVDNMIMTSTQPSVVSSSSTWTEPLTALQMLSSSSSSSSSFNVNNNNNGNGNSNNNNSSNNEIDLLMALDDTAVCPPPSTVGSSTVHDLLHCSDGIIVPQTEDLLVPGTYGNNNNGHDNSDQKLSLARLQHLVMTSSSGGSSSGGSSNGDSSSGGNSLVNTLTSSSSLSSPPLNTISASNTNSNFSFIVSSGPKSHSHDTNIPSPPPIPSSVGGGIMYRDRRIPTNTINTSTLTNASIANIVNTSNSSNPSVGSSNNDSFSFISDMMKNNSSTTTTTTTTAKDKR